MIRVLLFVCLFLPYAMGDVVAQKTEIGPRGSDVIELASSRTDPLVAVAVLESGELIRTADGGASFFGPSSSVAPDVFTADFCAAGACYVANDEDVFVSTDGALTFTVAAALPAPVRAIGASPHVGGEVWALVSDGRIVRSVDFGVTWLPADNFGAPVQAFPRAGVDAHPVNADEWLIHSSNRLWYTTNAGATSAQSQPLTTSQGVVRVIKDAALLEDNWVLLSEELSVGLIQTGVEVSTNSGATWSNVALTSLISNGRFRVTPSDPNEFWLGDFQQSLLRSIDGRQTVSFETTAAGRYGIDIAFPADAARPAIMATEHVLGQLDLAQLSFEASQGQSTSLPVLGIAADPRELLHLAALTDESIYESFDGGILWLDRGLPAATGFIPDVEFDASGQLWATGPGVFRHDGAQWHEAGPPIGNTVSALVASQVTPGTLYATYRGIGSGSLAVTEDAGASWSVTEYCANCPPGVVDLRVIERAGQVPRVVLLWDFARRLSYTDDRGSTLVTVTDGGGRVTLGQSIREGDRLAYWKDSEVIVTSDAFDTTLPPRAGAYGQEGLTLTASGPDLLVGIAMGGFGAPSSAVGVSADGGLSWTDDPSWTPALGDDPTAIALVSDERFVLVATTSGLFVLRLRPEASTFVCEQTVPNSVGRFATLSLIGSNSVAQNDIRFEATGLPAFTFCLPVAGSGTASLPGAGGSVGTLCLGGQLGRFEPQVAATTASGAFGFELDAAALPRGGAFVAATAGDTWTFQCWYRDVDAGQPSSHFTEAVRVVWAP